MRLRVENDKRQKIPEATQHGGTPESWTNPLLCTHQRLQNPSPRDDGAIFSKPIINFRTVLAEPSPSRPIRKFPVNPSGTVDGTYQELNNAPTVRSTERCEQCSGSVNT